MVPLNYNQLYYFFQIAETGSIALASKKVLISSPALSMQLKELEESMGTPLFSRVGKKLILTEAGKIVQEYARDIFNLGIELKDTLADRSVGKERSKIEIGCQDSVPKNVADQLLAFLFETKSCKVILREGNREELLDLQSDYKLDLILTNSIPQINNSVYETKLLCKEELIVVGHPKFKALKKNWPNSLSSAPLILPTYDSSTRQKLDFFFKEKNLQVDILAEVEDKTTEIDLAVNGHGLAVTMKSSVSDLLKRNILIEIGPLKKVDEEVWMTIGKRKLLNPIALFAMKNFQITHS
jgi:LysR family transcriptional activator of nhaA